MRGLSAKPLFRSLGFLFSSSLGGQFAGGEGWVFLCATAVALHVHFLQCCVRRHLAVLPLAFFQVLGVCHPTFAVSLPDGFSLPGRQVLPAILYCAVLATVVAFFLQLRHQGNTTPERAALVYATEPFFAALFGYALIGETFTVRGLAGALLLALAVLARPLSSLANRHRRIRSRDRPGN